MSSAARVAKSALAIALFAGGVIAGVMVYSGTQARVEYGPYPPLPEAAEPRVADELTDLVVDGQDRALAERYGPDLIEELQAALRFGSPEVGMENIVDVTDIKYLGTVSDGREQLAMYNIYGVTSGGLPVITGLSLRVSDGEVIGVNR